MPFDKWKARLKGEKVPTFTQPDRDDEGFYRIPIKEPVLGADGKTNGQKRTTGWNAVAIQLDDQNKLFCVVNGKEVPWQRAEDIWSYCVQNPVSWDVYDAVGNNGKPWPDLPAPKPAAAPPAAALPDAVPAANRDVKRSDNMPPDEEVLPAHIQHAQAIDTAIAAALTTVTTEDQVALALGSKNRLAELRLAAAREGQAIYKPLYNEYKTAFDQWTPPVARAEAKEKLLNKAVLTFRESERKRIAKEAADAEAVRVADQKRIDDENQRNADRAIAAGNPEPAPKVTTPAPAPASQLPPMTTSYGTRKPKEEIKTFVDTVTDWNALFGHFQGNIEVQDLLKKLAEKDARAGITVPGITTRQGLI